MATALLLRCLGSVFVICDETEFNPITDFCPITIIFIWAGCDNSIVEKFQNWTDAST